MFARVAVLAVALVIAGPVRAELRAGDEFPALASTDLEGVLPETKGQLLLVDFWASWCEPCRTSFPYYARLHADYGSRGLVVVAVSVDEDAGAYAKFVRKFSPPFAVVRDKDQALVRRVEVAVMPTCFLVGPDGRVRVVHRGFQGAETDRALRHEIDRLLASSAP